MSLYVQIFGGQNAAAELAAYVNSEGILQANIAAINAPGDGFFYLHYWK